jgi:TonB family protein
MRVLIVDQDSSLLTAITRSLGEHFTIDAVTTKADCLDLVRVNEFEVIVAGERLADGSGLELLGQLVKLRPNMIRIFAAERERLKLLKGRLGPFGLFRTLSYPIEPRQLLAALSAAGGTEEAEDTENVQHVALGDDAPEKPARAPAPTRPAPAPSRNSHPKTNSAPPPRQQTPQHAARIPGRRVRAAQSPRVSPAAMATPAQTAAADSAPTRPSSPQTARRPAARTPDPPGSRLRTSARPADDSASEASRVASAARAKNSQLPEVTGKKRRAFLVGAGVVVILGVMGIAYKLFAANEESVTATTGVSVVPTPHFPAQVVNLVADTETAFQHDDFKRARANVQTLQQIAPNHPRLSFFESLLRRREEASASEAATTATPAVKTPSRVRRTPSVARTSAHASVPAQKTRPAQPSTSVTTAATTAATGSGSSSAAIFAGKTLEDSSSGGVPEQPITPSQAATAPVPRPDSSPSVTQHQEPRLIEHVPAAYPPSAASRGIEGVVEVSFSVSIDGTVNDVTVVSAEPADVFNQAAIAAVRRWKYEPKTVNGTPVEAHMQLSLEFKMDQLEP